MLHRKPRILVVGSFVMDVIATTERVPASGQTVYGKSFHTAPGGKGANQALQCARLGAEVTMMGSVGDDLFGQSEPAAQIAYMADSEATTIAALKDDFNGLLAAIRNAGLMVSGQ